MIKSIPIEGSPKYAHSSLKCSLGLREIEFILNYCPFLQIWDLTIREDGVNIVAGLTLVIGSNLLQSVHTDLGKLYLIGDEPTLDNLGVDNTLIWVSNDESI